MISGGIPLFDPAGIATTFEDWTTEYGVDTGATAVWTGALNGLVLSQATSAKRPTLVKRDVNGYDALAFDHTATQHIGLASFVHAQPYGFLLVYKCTNQSAASNNDNVITFGPTTATRYVISDTTPRCFLSGGTNLAGSPQVKLAEAKYSYLVAYLNGTSSWFSIDGRRVNVGDAGTSATTQLTLAGFSDSTHCTTISASKMTWFGALTSDEEAKMATFCRRKYGIVGRG